jgi:hypothetical protein
MWESYFKFSIARNPWDRTLSRFFWRHRGNPALKPQKKLYHQLGVPYDDLTPARALFLKFLREEEWETNDKFYIIDGELCVDFVVRYEHLSDDLDHVLKRVNLPSIELPRLKSGFRKGEHHYSEYYDDEGRNLVAERHQNDIRLFGYSFEKI